MVVVVVVGCWWRAGKWEITRTNTVTNYANAATPAFFDQVAEIRTSA